MKKTIFPFFFFLIAISCQGQENRFSLYGGWSNANIEDVANSANGWRIGGLYEYIPWKSKFSHGFSFGYIGLTTDSSGITGKSTYDIGSIPLYYAPKYSFGKEKIQAFLKGALGVQFSSLKKNYPTGGSIKSNDFGFALGAGAGLSLFLNEKLFLTGEYELLWVSNSFYRDGLINSALIGIGMRLK